MSRRRFVRPVVTVALVLAAAATALAQRGGYRNYSRSYTGNVKYDGKFVFVRMSYPYFNRNTPPWSHDYPAGEEHFMKILTTITNVTGHVEESSIMAFSDPEIFKFPLIYLCEPGYWSMSDEEVVALRTYLQKGGFMVVDDFPSWAWGNFDLQMSRVFPEGRWIDLDTKHPIWHSFFEINSLDMPTYYNLGGRPIFRAMFEGNDPNKRMYVIANYQNDISEYWEWSETGYKPVDESNDAYKFGVNEFIYGITH
jgi:Domain of unknown function (DUF4159)